MENANFIAIDFETATLSTRMPCQIGIAVVKEGKIVETYSSLIKPPGNRYSSKNMTVHGITPKQTQDAPSFDEVWKDIEHLFRANFLVAHNASFDLDVLDKALKRYEIKHPIIMGSDCTFEITRAGLKDTCEINDVELLDRHDALSDAVACANIYIKYLNGTLITPLYEDSSDEIENRSTKPKQPWFPQSIGGDLLGMDLEGADPNHPLYMKEIAITGTFDKWERTELAELFKSKGAHMRGGVTKNIDFVAVGVGAGPSKLEKIDELRESGRVVTIIDEVEIEKLLTWKNNG